MLLDRVTALEWLRARFELSRGGAGQNIRPMEGLRGFAVFLVFLVHYANLIRPWLLPESSLLEFAKALRLVGSSGVDLFFVLSGFVIYGSLISREQPFGRFLLRRVRRIYPAFIVVLSGYVVLSLCAGGESLSHPLIYASPNTAVNVRCPSSISPKRCTSGRRRCAGIIGISS